MKTQAFIIRVVICFLLSLIPLTELENRLYDVRLRIHGPIRSEVPLILVQLDSSLVGRPIALESLKHEWIQAGARAILDPRELGRSTPRTWLPDPDGIVRASSTFDDSGEASLPARKALELKLVSRDHLTRSDRHLIRFAAAAGRLKRCTPVQIRSSQCGELTGTVLVLELLNTARPDLGGPSPLVDGPRFRTPFGEMSESELLAHDFATLIGSREITRAGWPFRILISLAMILFSAMVIQSYSILFSAIAVSGMGVVLVLVAFQAIFSLFDLYVPGANPALSMLIAYLVFTGYRMALQENLQWRALKQSQYLRELDQMKTNFLSLVSHDLKTPLAKIQGATDRLKRELQLPAQRELLESVENSTAELRHFINRLLSLSRIESQKVILNKKSNDLNVLIQQVIQRLSPLAQQKGIHIESDLEPLFSVECDEDLMRQVITNLIDNAIKYSPPDSRILVRTREGDGQIQIDVEDFGPGIPKNQLPLMFGKFSRYVRPIHETVKGTGLGLYLSKYFIELHGGTIRLKSDEGKGTTFSVTLPLHGEAAGSLLG